MEFSSRELRDLLVAWAALGLAFTFFILAPGGPRALMRGEYDLFGGVFVLSLVTVGVGFLLHELAHKVVAIRFGQAAAFRADYGMLGLAVLVSLAGFLFAAPGAVYHRGYVTARENGLIAVAGPLTNLALLVVFVPLFYVGGPGGFLRQVGQFGATINVFLAGFNMLPFGPLDGRKVLDWSKVVFALVLVGSVGLGFVVITKIGFPEF